MMQKIVISFGLWMMMAPAAAGQAFPPPPQSATSNDGVDAPGFVRVPSTAHDGIGGGFIDVPAYASCRYVTVTNPNAGGEAIAMQSLSNWQRWQANPHSGDSASVCCRPGAVTLCAGAAGGTVAATVTGAGASGYAIFGGTGTATARCTDQWGETYQDTRTYQCGQTGSGVTADGQWGQMGGDTYTCGANAYTTTGACSTAGSGGWGNLYQTVYNSCGQITSQGYNGPSCYTAPPCTPNWQQNYEGCTASACGTWGSNQYWNYDANSCGAAGYTSYSGSCYAGACPPPETLYTTFCQPMFCSGVWACDCNYFPSNSYNWTPWWAIGYPTSTGYADHDPWSTDPMWSGTSNNVTIPGALNGSTPPGYESCGGGFNQAGVCENGNPAGATFCGPGAFSAPGPWYQSVDWSGSWNAYVNGYETWTPIGGTCNAGGTCAIIFSQNYCSP